MVVMKLKMILLTDQIIKKIIEFQTIRGILYSSILNKKEVKTLAAAGINGVAAPVTAKTAKSIIGLAIIILITAKTFIYIYI